MEPLSIFPIAKRASIRGVFTDIDDTLTTDGRLTAEAYSAMESLQKKGMAVVPITGRPAGWCDHIARMWPVDGVVGENGAFYFCYDREKQQMARRYVDGTKKRKNNMEKLLKLGQTVLDNVPGAAISADQLYRETDLAIDHGEDVPSLTKTEIHKVVNIFEKAGATAKISSIHVNAWFGTYDKLTMTKLYAEDCLGVNLNNCESDFVFSGDSPNDVPMFSFFSNSVGVANVLDFEDTLTVPPQYITKNRGGLGFSELAKALIQAKTGSP